ncbi:MAG: DUF116 domain-containing protein [Kiritimatiellae bacterium]|nr:DUF116 domain-containing protein [Kiritimatiellia bacterium]MDD5521832.1 DUF116 domain-containing protein [Kiritimatiellia bacterium]
MWRRVFIRLSNRVTAWRQARVPARNLLLLLPHCLHNDTCRQNVVRNLDECLHCGKCSISDLVKVRNDYGVIGCIVGGGSQAALQAQREDVKAVVAVACDRELFEGIVSAFPKPVVAISNETPEGPCHNTKVDINKVKVAIESLIEK